MNCKEYIELKNRIEVLEKKVKVLMASRGEDEGRCEKYGHVWYLQHPLSYCYRCGKKREDIIHSDVSE